MRRLLLDDRQCRLFMKAMHDFGYPHLTLEKVKETAAAVHKGTHRDTDVIALMMVQQIDEMAEELERTSHAKKPARTTKKASRR